MAQEHSVTPAEPAALPRQVYKVAALTGRKRTHVIFAPDAPARKQIAVLLGLIDLPMLRLEGEITPEGRHDLRFTGEIAARAVQACIVTLAPVPVMLKELCCAAICRISPTPRATRPRWTATTAPRLCQKRLTPHPLRSRR